MKKNLDKEFNNEVQNYYDELNRLNNIVLNEIEKQDFIIKLIQLG